MNLFPDTPPPTDAARRRLSGHLSNEKKLKTWIRESRPSLPNLKRAVTMEAEGRKRDAVLKALVAAIQKRERAEIAKKINRRKQ